jgi:hypothetical protein
MLLNVSVFKTTYVTTRMNKIDEIDRCLKACKTELSLLMSQDVPVPVGESSDDFNVTIDLHVDGNGFNHYRDPGIFELVMGRTGFGFEIDEVLGAYRRRVRVDANTWKINLGTHVYVAKKPTLTWPVENKWTVRCLLNYNESNSTNSYRGFRFSVNGGPDAVDFFVEE